MKQALLTTTFVAALWLIAVASYTIFECRMEYSGANPISTFDFRAELVKALNVGFPLSVGCLLFLLKTNQTDPVRPEVFRLCLITCVLGVFLSFKAKNAAFPDPSDPVIAEGIWWLPSPGLEVSDY